LYDVFTPPKSRAAINPKLIKTTSFTNGDKRDQGGRIWRRKIDFSGLQRSAGNKAA
jgi:hypothetical protein